MTEVRKNTFGYIVTIILSIIYTFSSLLSIILFFGGDVTVNNVKLDLSNKWAKIFGALNLTSSLAVLAVLVLMLAKPHFLDEKESTKLSPILLAGILAGAGEWVFNSKIIKYNNIKGYYIPFTWIFFVIFFALYRYVHAFRPYRPIKTSGLNP